jgi:organic hydroperoxide reductase OsmC/OhrA
MPSITVDLRNVPGTEAALGWAGGNTAVVDRPAGRAGGMGLGFNGGELLALAIGGCFCNDLRYEAHAAGVDLAEIAVHVVLELDGDPLLATGATMQVTCRTADGSDAREIVERATRSSTVSNSLVRVFPVTVGPVPEPAPSRGAAAT